MPLGLTLAFLVVNPQLTVHLAAWEKQAQGWTKFRAEFTVTKKDGVFRTERQYTGSILGQPPGRVVLRLENVADKAEHEAYVCDGQFLYEYSGITKTVTEYRLPKPGSARPEGEGNRLLAFLRGQLTFEPAESLVFRMLSGAITKEVGTRFDTSLFKEDERYVYLDLWPRLPKDQQEMERVRVALYGPDVKPPQVSYTPASMFVLRPNGDTETWAFTEVKVNLPGVDEKVFRPLQVPGFTPGKPRVPPKSNGGEKRP
jgi:TIGR03009 family protein